ncbi:MAG: hypothetical protein MR277_02060 [Methanobrevibacter ruminantium]|uniref:hypothetical protein n=1 Tax=Methanobrevibacter ruminantium TaxID=83816 RepID=UPI002D7EA127|nr:hypothetical protein [Methanobrevibacter ruminantium]MCI5736782.1 hypothetical protein [Methanobrevibacter ruminantium]
MKEITAILLILIALIGIISIIIVKIYYKDKEKDNEEERLAEFINSTKSDYDNEKRKRTRKAQRRNRANLSEAQLYANTIDDVENGDVGGTTALLRQRAKAMDEAPQKQARKFRRAQPVPKNVPRTPERVKTQMNKEEEVKSFQEPIKPEHTATINSARQGDKQPEARQVPMTEKQKEFISGEANKLVVEEGEGNVKVVKSVKPAETIEEIKESAKIEEDAQAEEAVETEAEAKDEIVQKAEADTADLIKKIEKAKEDVEEKLADISAEDIGAVKEKMAKEEEEAETPDIGTTIEKIKQASEAKEEAKAETEAKVEEVKTEVVEAPKAEETSQTAEDSYHDDLHILLNKEEPVEADESPENDFVTINSGNEEKLSTGNELINSAIKSIRNFRKANTPQQPTVVETKVDIVPDDYAQDLGDGIEYIGDTITITPIHEEERDLAKTQPNEDVDKIYKEINKESYNKTDDEELSDSFEDVTDETSEKDANVYTKEDYKKIEAKEKEKVRRAENTKKILGSKGISEEEVRKRSEAKAKSKRTRRAAPAEEPVEEGQKRLMMHKAKTDVEEVYINGTLFELKVGQIVIFDINGESYSSQILRLKPGYIGVRYRSKKIWVKSNTVKKILK